MDKKTTRISELKIIHGSLCTSKIDLINACIQIPLHQETQKHCNFNIIGGNTIGLYRFLK